MPPFLSPTTGAAKRSTPSSRLPPLALSLAFLVVTVIPFIAVDAHESCCEKAKRARAARRLHTVVISKATEACPWLLLGLITTALLAAAKTPVGSIRSLLTTDDASATKDVPGGGGTGTGSRLIESVRLTLFASLLGLITPLCSCGALPLAAGLIAAGADLRAVVAFLTAAQSAGLDSAAVTVGILGWRVAAFRLVGSVVLAVASGVAVGTGGGRKRNRNAEKKDDGLASATRDETSATTTTCCAAEEKKSDDPCCASDSPSRVATTPEKLTGEAAEGNEEGTSSFWLWTFLRSLVDTFDEIWPVLLVGVFITACVEKIWTGDSLPLQPSQPPRPAPPGWDEEDDGPWDDGSSEDSSFLAALGLPFWAVDLLVRISVVAAALPLQLCEHGVVSFAAALERAGATPGTAHAFLLSAPATNAASLGVLVRAGRGGGGGPGTALKGAAGIAVAAVALSYVADRPDVLGGEDGGGKIGNAVETFSLPGWFADLSVYSCAALLAASLASRAARLLQSGGSGRGESTTMGADHMKTD